MNDQVPAQLVLDAVTAQRDSNANEAAQLRALATHLQAKLDAANALNAEREGRKKK